MLSCSNEQLLVDDFAKQDQGPNEVCVVSDLHYDMKWVCVKHSHALSTNSLIFSISQTKIKVQSTFLAIFLYKIVCHALTK